MVTHQQQQSTASGSYRRDVMKALGAGTALGVFGGVASAQDQEDEPGEDDPTETEEEPAETDEDVLERTVHIVRTLITESTNPERPADFFYQPTGLHIEEGDVIKFVFETPDHTVTSYHPVYGMQRRIPSGVQPFSSPLLGWDPQSLPADIDMPPGENGEPVEENGAEEENGENADQNGENEENGDADEQSDEQEAAAPVPSTWLYAFETPGVYDLECAPHEGFGMAMRVVVGEETETAFETSDPDDLPPPRAGPVGLSRGVLTDPNLEPESIVEQGRVEWLDLEVNQDGENGANDTEEDENGEADNDDGNSEEE